jgi:hypothetical protein
MATRRQPTLRTLIMLLALVNLAMLGLRLWPWTEVMSLPGNGTTGIDPAVTLAAYFGLAYWIGTAREDESRKALFSAASIGLVAGLLLVVAVVAAARKAAADVSAGPDRMEMALLACAAVVIGFAGLRTAKAGHTMAFSTVCGLWAAMVACLMAAAAVLAETYLAAGPGESSDPWKDYQGIAIGTPAMQSLVHSLDTISGLLLIGPLIGCIAGAVFASFGKPKSG